MARIREVLRRTDTERRPPPVSGPAPGPERTEEPSGHTAVEEEIPFIEVGGRDSPVEASASVLASSPKPLSRGQAVEAHAAQGGASAQEPPPAEAEAQLTVLYISFCRPRA